MKSALFVRTAVLLGVVLGGCYGVPPETESGTQALLYCEGTDRLTNVTRVCHYALGSASVSRSTQPHPATPRASLCNVYCICGYNHVQTTDENGNRATDDCSPGTTARSDQRIANPRCFLPSFRVPFQLAVSVGGTGDAAVRACARIGSDQACVSVCNQVPTRTSNITLSCCMPSQTVSPRGFTTNP